MKAKVPYYRLVSMKWYGTGFIEVVAFTAFDIRGRADYIAIFPNYRRLINITTTIKDIPYYYIDHNW